MKHQETLTVKDQNLITYEGLKRRFSLEEIRRTGSKIIFKIKEY